MNEQSPQSSGKRRVLGSGLGFVAGSLVMMVIQAVNYLLFPPPPGLDFNDPSQLPAIVAAMPLTALLLVELSYALGCLVAGMVLAWVVPERERRYPLGLGLVFTALGFVNLTQFPAPLWLAVLTTITYVPGVFVGVFVIRRLRPQGPKG